MAALAEAKENRTPRKTISKVGLGMVLLAQGEMFIGAGLAIVGAEFGGVLVTAGIVHAFLGMVAYSVGPNPSR